MKSSRFRSTYITLGLFVILLLFVLFYANDGVQNERRNYEYDKPYLTEDQVSSVDQMRFERPDEDAVVLQLNENKEWTVEGLILDKEESTALMSAIRKLPFGKSVSRNSENWGKYSLTDDEASILVLSSGDSVVSTFYIGKRGDSVNSTYMRRNKDNTVYSLTTTLRPFFEYPLSRWRDKRIIQYDKDLITGFRLRLAEEQWTFVLENGVWMTRSEGESTPIANTELLDAYLERISSYRAVSINDDESIFVKADHEASFTMADGTESTVLVDEIEGSFNAKIGDLPGVFVLDADFVSQFRPDFLAAVEKSDSEIENNKETPTSE